MHPVQSTFSGLKIGNPTHYENLTVFPLTAPHGSSLDYLLLGDAVAAGLSTVSEVSTAGSVPELRVENKAGKPVLIMDGEELIGAKQNRVANLSILVPAKDTIAIPVSCVEQGRWSYSTRDFSVSDRAQFARSRAAKLSSVHDSLEMNGTRRSDQGRVWASIREKADAMGTESQTDAMGDIFEGHRAGLNDYVRAFDVHEGQIGGLFAIGGQISGVDLFDQPATFQTLFAKILRSYAIDAMEAGPGSDAPPSRPAAEQFLDRLREATIESYPAVGLGTDFRLLGRALTAGGLLVDDTIVHLAAFNLQPADVPARPASRGRVLSMGQRRRNSQRRKH